MQVLRDGAAKKGETVPVTKDVMTARKCLSNQDYGMALSEFEGAESNSEYDTAAEAVRLMGDLESTVFPQFVKFLAKKNRLQLLEPMMDHYVSTLYKTESIAPVIVSSAAPLADSERKSLKEKLTSLTGASSIKLIEKVDTQLVAGFKIEWDFLDPDRLITPQMEIDLSMKSHISNSGVKRGVA